MPQPLRPVVATAAIALVLCSGSAIAQAVPQAPAADPTVERTFGNEGEPGSFYVQFDRRGGGVFLVQLMDHWRSVEARAQTPHEPDDYMLLVYNGSNDALRLEETGSSHRFPQNLLVAEWRYQETSDAATFTIDSGDGLTLRRTLRHDPAARGFVLELGLANTGTDGGGQVALQLRGPALANPAHTTLVGNSSIAIAATNAGATEHKTPAAGKLQPFSEIDVRDLAFAGNTSRFFGAFVYPRNEVAGRVLTGLAAATGPSQPFPADVSDTKPNSVVQMLYDLALPIPARGEETVAEFGLYLGPKSYGVFDTLPAPLQDRFDPVLDVDLSGGCCFEIPGARQMAYLLLSLLGWFHDFVGNWGLAIIMLTILVRGLLAPLNFRMQKSMRVYSSKMAVLKPKLDKLKEQYADDPKAYQQAMYAFQREHKIIPPIGGCLPIFLTMPVYIGLFTALRTAYDLRQQPFVGWIQDLSLSDSFVALGFWPHVLNLLPLVWMGLFLFMSLRQPLPTDPQQRQIQSIMRLMPLMMGVMLYGYASALLLYMVTSMLWSLGESAVIKRILGPVDPNVASMTPTPM
ncbi:MAG: membrane protein insertase YidC [Planctomycetes bacterium]|nr:membrane protein insertase YidC [Planctomycetota bacterium]